MNVEDLKSVSTRPLFRLKGQESCEKFKVNETIEHRELVLLRAAGLSIAQAARRVGISYQVAASVLRTPWATQMLGELAHKAIGKELENRLQQIASEATVIAQNIMRETEDEKLKASCAFKFLELQVGKKVTVNNKTNKSLEQIEKELKETQQEMEKLQNGTN
jgi:hypothetical protein